MRKTHLDRTEDPQDQRLYNDKGGGSGAQGEVYANVPAHARVLAFFAIDLRPILEPYTATYRERISTLALSWQALQERKRKVIGSQETYRSELFVHRSA